MAGAAASETILFIAAILVTTAVVGTFSVVIGQLAGDVETRGKFMSDELRTHITIINDPLAVDVDPDLEVFVKNTGAKTLLVPDVDIFIDGQPMATANVTNDVLESSDDDSWRQGQVLQISVANQTFADGVDYRIRIVTASGISDSFTFTAVVP